MAIPKIVVFDVVRQKSANLFKRVAPVSQVPGSHYRKLRMRHGDAMSKRGKLHGSASAVAADIE